MVGIIGKTVSRQSREYNQHGHASFGAVFTGTRRYWITSEHNPSRIYVPGIVAPGLFKPFCVQISFIIQSWAQDALMNNQEYILP
jgi:hypothetical protein